MTYKIPLTMLLVFVALSIWFPRGRLDTPTHYPNGVPLPLLNTPIPQDLTIGPTYNQTGSGNTVPLMIQDAPLVEFHRRPLEFQFDGWQLAAVTVRDRQLVYTIGKKEVGRKEFYRWMDAWLLKQAGLWTPPTVTP